MSPRLPVPGEPDCQGRAGCSPAHRLRLCCRHRQLEVLGRSATAERSLVLPMAAGTGAASPTSRQLPCTPHGVPHLETALQAAKPQKGQAWLKRLTLAQGTAFPAWRQLILGAVPKHAGSYWGRMRLMSRGISKD